MWCVGWVGSKDFVIYGTGESMWEQIQSGPYSCLQCMLGSVQAVLYDGEYSRGLVSFLGFGVLLIRSFCIASWVGGEHGRQAETKTHQNYFTCSIALIRVELW
jgi:hypothetical protein